MNAPMSVRLAGGVELLVRATTISGKQDVLTRGWVCFSSAREGKVFIRSASNKRTRMRARA
eukprot:1469637-Lingulodinium_polyedra.AAC.1